MFHGYWAGAAALGGFIAMLLAVILAKKKFNIPSARKAIHISGGLLAMLFPWLGKWNYILPAIVIACFILVALRLTSRFKKDKEAKASGDFLYDTGSLSSLGEVVFPMVMAFLTWVTRLDPFLFVTPMAVLALADSSAALIGSKYGKSNMASHGEDKKTQCGSFVFFGVCMIIIPVSALLLTDYDIRKIFIISLMAAAAATIFEMTSSHGMDNLLVPVSVFLMLDSLGDLSYEQILIKFAYVTMIFLVLSFTRLAKLFSTFSYLQFAMMLSISLISACWYAAASVTFVSLLITFEQKIIKKMNVCIVKPSIMCSCYSIVVLAIYNAGIIPAHPAAVLFFAGNFILIGYTLYKINDFLPAHHKKQQIMAK